MSLAARLLEWLLAPLLFVWLLGLGMTFLVARETVDSALDDQLNLAAGAVYDEWRDWQLASAISTSDLPIFPSTTLTRILRSDSRYPIRYLIADAKGRALAGDEALIALLRASEVDPAPFDDLRRAPGKGLTTALDEDFVRSLRVSINVDGGEQRLVVVQSRARQERLLRSIMLYEAIPQTAAIAMAALLVWYGLTYVTRPMRKLKEHLDLRGVGDLRALPAQLAPAELTSLIQSINDLMARLQTSLAAQNRFIANAAHQLRTPLAAMRAHSELLQRVDDPRRRQETINQLIATSARATRLVTQLLSLVRAESSGTTSQFVDVELNMLCRLVASEVLPLALERNIEFGIDAHASPVTIKGDSTLLSELVHNLVDNALKYTPRNGTVTVRIVDAPPRISVEDSGPGISAHERERVFAPFARVARFEEGSHHAIAGTGLGLAIVEEVARAHRARIEIEQSRYGGASFVVSFPSGNTSIIASLFADPYGQIH
jgi:two-component system, OmpR family, sensor histidine kinase TctE